MLLSAQFTERILSRFLRVFSSAQRIRDDLEIVKTRLAMNEQKLETIISHLDIVRRDIATTREFIGTDGTESDIEQIIKDAADGSTIFNPKNLAVLRAVDAPGLAVLLNAIEPGYIESAFRLMEPERRELVIGALRVMLEDADNG